MIKELIYKDIDPTRYLIDDDGNIYKKNGKKLNGCNPNNEKGYIRISLMTIDGKIKKYPVHRLVIGVFDHISDLPVDHINADKTCNKFINLEYVTYKENSERAVNLGLYKVGEMHHKAILTDNQVHEICKLYEKGYSTRKIEKLLSLGNIHNIDKILTDILYGKSWKHISKMYSIDIDNVRYKTYSKNDLLRIINYVLKKKKSSKEIANKFPQYDQKKLINVIKKIRQEKIYKDLIEEVKRSTTIVDKYGLVHIHRR